MKDTARLIKMFGVALRGDSVDMYTWMQAFKSGYLIDPKCSSTPAMKQFIYEQNIDLSSTFYKSWSIVENLSLTERLMDQLTHYFANYTMGCNWIPEHEDIPDLHLDQFKIIPAISPIDLYMRCTDLAYSNTALNSDVASDIVHAIASGVQENGFSIHLDKILNREIRIGMYVALGKMPSDPREKLACLVRKLSGITQIVQSKQFLYELRTSAKYYKNTFGVLILSKEDCDSLSTIFNRYKNVFMAFKPINPSAINHISKLAKKNHQPFQASFWDCILSHPKPFLEIRNKFQEINGLRIVRLMAAIRERIIMACSSGGKKMFKIRNGRVHFRDYQLNPFTQNLQYLETLYDMLLSELVGRLKKSDLPKTIILPHNIQLTCPTSGKSFVGGYPYGSFMALKNHNYLAINWRGEDGADDFDLSYLTKCGTKIGWNAEYSDSGIMYSGDMVVADPEATEALYFPDTVPDGLICANLYSGEPGSQYSLCIGQEQIDNLPLGYMIDPRNLLLKEKITATQRANMCGLVVDNKLYMFDLQGSNQHVSEVLSEGVFESLANNVRAQIPLEPILKQAGFKIRKTRPSKSKYIDLRNGCFKDTMLKMFDI